MKLFVHSFPFFPPVSQLLFSNLRQTCSQQSHGHPETESLTHFTWSCDLAQAYPTSTTILSHEEFSQSANLVIFGCSANLVTQLHYGINWLEHSFEVSGEQTIHHSPLKDTHTGLCEQTNTKSLLMTMSSLCCQVKVVEVSAKAPRLHQVLCTALKFVSTAGTAGPISAFYSIPVLTHFWYFVHV